MPSIFMLRPHLRDLPDVPPLPAAYELREATGEADVPALAAALSAAFSERPWSADDVRRRLTAAPDVRAVYAITWQGEIVATASSRYLPEQFGETGIIHWVGTHPEHARLGLGAALVTGVLVDFILRGYPAAMLETQDYRLDAIRLYLRFGFTPAYDIGDGDQRAIWSALLQRLFAAH
jgi:mycothiol synthase